MLQNSRIAHPIIHILSLISFCFTVGLTNSWTAADLPGLEWRRSGQAASKSCGRRESPAWNSGMATTRPGKSRKASEGAGLRESSLRGESEGILNRRHHLHAKKETKKSRFKTWAKNYLILQSIYPYIHAHKKRCLGIANVRIHTSIHPSFYPYTHT